MLKKHFGKKQVMNRGVSSGVFNNMRSMFVLMWVTAPRPIITVRWITQQ